MTYLRRPFLAALAMVAFAALAVAGTASATTLEVGGTAQTQSVWPSASLAFGTSLLLKDELGTTTDTCTGSGFEFQTSSKQTGSEVSGPVFGFTLTGCTHTTHMLSSGNISISHISGTTDGTVRSSLLEFAVKSTYFGITAYCSTASGRDIGRLTGKASGQAVLDLNATINCGILGNASWTGTYTITWPTGLGVVS